MDRIKDFFHDFSDVFFAIAIGGIMFFVLSANLGSWFTNSSNIVLADEPVNITDNNNTSPKPENDIEKENVEDAENEDVPDENNESTDTKEEPDNVIDSNKNEVDADDNVVNTEVKTIVIPNGTPGSGVAKILKESGLIEDTQDFIKAAENLNLAVRLKSGTFEIPNNSTIEDMVKIIAGQKR